MPVAAIAERFQELGFRVIEGGKSGNTALLKTPGIAEMFSMLGRAGHANVLRDLRLFRKRLSSNLIPQFDEHCRETTYRGKRRQEICFEVTKIGFLAIAPKYDTSLGFLLALAFDALERGDVIAQDRVIKQINDRISELRLKASGQNDLAFDTCEHDESTTTTEDAHVEQINEYADDVLAFQLEQARQIVDLMEHGASKAVACQQVGALMTEAIELAIREFQKLRS